MNDPSREALALADAHPNKTWARRYLRLHSTKFLPYTAANEARRERKQKKFVRGAASTSSAEPK